jgi:transcriptional adapter 2-alpha
MSRDYYASERLNQLRGGTGRKCGCVAYHPSANVFLGESEGRKSHERESTPKLSANATVSARRPRTSIPPNCRHLLH